MENMENVEKTEIKTTNEIPLVSSDVDTYRDIFKFLNEKDRDLLYLVFISGCKQKNVKRIMKRSQSSLTYDVAKIRERLGFVYYLMSVFDTFIEFIERKDNFLTPKEKDILALIYFTTSMTTSAKVLGVTQIRVRYAFTKILAKLEANNEWDVYEIFMAIRTRFNAIKRGRLYRDKK